MKPAPFDYFAPDSLETALSIKTEHGEEAKPLAGGQSLIPSMNFRVLQPSILIDLNYLDELRYIKKGNGELHIGAMTTQAEVEHSQVVSKSHPLIHETMPYIAHHQIRNRGTFGGSLVHADPASELPVIATALNARFQAQSVSGKRWINVDDFFVTMFTVSLNPDEILIEISIPELPQNTGCSFMEVSRRHGDFAMAGVAALVTIDKQGICKDARLVYLNVGDKAIDAIEAANLLKGKKITSKSIEAAANIASNEEIMPFGSVHATPEYQRHLSRVITKRAVEQAHHRAKSLISGNKKR